MRSSLACDIRAWATFAAMVFAVGGIVFMVRFLYAWSTESERRERRRLIVWVILTIVAFLVSASISWDGSECPVPR